MITSTSAIEAVTDGAPVVIVTVPSAFPSTLNPGVSELVSMKLSALVDCVFAHPAYRAEGFASARRSA